MEPGREQLWQGGPWEQPAQVITLPPEVKIPKGKKRRRGPGRGGKVFLFITMLACIGALVCVLILLGQERERRNTEQEGRFHIVVESGHMEQPTIPRAPTGTGVTVEIQPLPEQALSYSQVYEKNQHSIVTVHVADQYGMSQGTGIVLTQDGYVITNAHVIEGADMAMVVLNDDAMYEAQLVGCSMQEDLAVLKIDVQGLIPAEFGDSHLLRVGDAVSALGSPLGYRMTMTSGIVSAVDRKLEIDGESMYLLQTDAAINFGNSGGALFNDRGQVVGVTTAKIVADDGSTEALGFAIPSERMKYVVDLLIAGEEIKTPALGVTVQYDPDVAGLTVIKIESWSDAVAQGVQVGDVLTAVAGREIRTNRDLEREKDLHRVGEQLRLDVRRGAEGLVFFVLLQDWEQKYDEAP